ncbi:MAG: hypothetical protein LPK03_01655 [Pontibacter sp.]|nr:hypothetical protein [Pontibacter sp.]
MVLIVFPPTYQQAVSPSTAILLTEGYNQDTLEALLKQQEAKPTIYTLDAEYDKAIPLNSLYELRQQHPGLATVHIIGYGLEADQLQTIQDVQIIPHLTVAPAGVTTVQWSQEKRLGQQVAVTGQFSGFNNSWLYLSAAGQLRDSVEVEKGKKHTFKLTYTPKLPGRFVYMVLARHGEKLDTLGQIPVEVKEQQPLSVLLFASAPSFEFKFLKNHLAEQQQQVAYRATISKGINQSEWVNMPEANLTRITPQLLQRFDMVITEPKALEQLSTAERNTLQHATNADGLGVLTIATEPANNRNTNFFTGFQSKRISQQSNRTAQAQWNTSRQAIDAAPYVLAPSTEITPLIKEKEENLLAGAKRAGWGKVALSYLPQTFPWKLKGKHEVYTSYWASLLSAIAKEEVKEKFWELVKPLAPKLNKPVSLTFTDYTLGENALVPTATVVSLADSISTQLQLAQHTYQPEKYSGTFWPRNFGWHKVETPDAEPYYFYVQQESDWANESIAARIAATEAYVAKQQTNSPPHAVKYQRESFPVIWFFALFVLSSGLLWLEEKL